jgi:hypothetical protein
VNLASATAAPSNNPAVAAATALSAGTDDRGSIVASTYTATLARFGPELGAGAVAIPGQTSSAVGAGLISHAATYNRIALLAPAAGTDVAGAVTAAAALRGTANSEYAGLFWPWVKIDDGAGGFRTISPEGFVAALRARAHSTVGPWRMPVANAGISQGHITAAEVAVTKAQVDQLFDADVSPIRTMPGGVRLYGWRSLSVDDLNFADLNDRDILNYIVAVAEDPLEEIVGQPINDALYSRMELILHDILAPMANAGGLVPLTGTDGTQLQPAFIIDTGPSVNTAQVVQARQVKASVGVRTAEGANLISVTITKTAVGTGF